MPRSDPSRQVRPALAARVAGAVRRRARYAWLRLTRGQRRPPVEAALDWLLNLESEGGLLFTTKEMLRQKVIRLACNEKLRLELGENLCRYLENVVSWDIVARQYEKSYRLAREAKRQRAKVELPLEF